MFWPIVLPCTIAFWGLAALVAASTAFAPWLKWNRGKTSIIASALALVAFIPSCTGIMLAVDTVRFGHFEFQTFDDINDFRAERYLPTAAANIRMHKYANGYQARYSISDSDFQTYLNDLWDQYGEYSAVERGGFCNEGSPATQMDFERTFAELGWKSWGNATVYHSPSEPDGGGATYYFDRDAGVAFQRTSYW